MNGHKYTEEEKRFLSYYVSGHSYKEIQKEFIERFNWNITMSQLKSCIGRYKLNTGRTGQFKKGNVPHNKGKKGVCAKGSEKGWFKKGNVPVQHKEVGTERITKDGYIEIKVEEPNKWMLKHRFVWEQENGKVPKGYIVIFKDGNRLNTGLENLILVKRSVSLRMNNTGLCRYNGELKDTAVTLANLMEETSNARKKLEKKGTRYSEQSK